ncbi:hypothetical protein [Arthrobacter sp. MYb227]|uniref:hypothetical protein n=1 Tax=Arthrobacter sp. MYb227 TaxID=1848601 RepID=UPI000CFB00C0|nr:hypothetical protein [Arthrobacter sp. MYb227]
MRIISRSAGLGAICIGLVLVSAACAQGPASSGDSQPCPPPQYSLGSSSVSAGGELKISAQDATCDPRYGQDAQIQLQLLDSANQVLETKLAPMADAGSFDYTLKLPASLKPGTYGISATPHNLDWCDDTGVNNRIENPSFGTTGLVMVRASCMMPLEQFTLTK